MEQAKDIALVINKQDRGCHISIGYRVTVQIIQELFGKMAGRKMTRL